MDANMAHYCLHQLHKFPSEYLNLPRREKAFLIASVQIKVKRDKDEERKMVNKSKK